MKTRTLFTVLGFGLTLLSSALVLVVMVSLQDNRELRRELGAVRAELQGARTEVGQLRDETSDATERLAAKESRLETLENELAKAKAADAGPTGEAGATPAVPRAHKVRAYVGTQYLGLAWLVPSPRPRAPETGQVSYEPIIVLDESLKRNLVVHQTNVVERAVPWETTINYNYPYPYWYYPVFVWHGTNPPTRCDTNRPPGTTPGPPQPGIQQPAKSKPLLSTRGFVPRAKLLLPPVTPARPAPIKLQANLIPNARALRPQVVGSPDSRRNVNQPRVPPGS
jgi:hypothetical protein